MPQTRLCLQLVELRGPSAAPATVKCTVNSGVLPRPCHYPGGHMLSQFEAHLSHVGVLGTSSEHFALFPPVGKLSPTP